MTTRNSLLGESDLRRTRRKDDRRQKDGVTAPAILVVTGASGTGKTTVVRRLEARSVPGIQCHYLDADGVPSVEDMQRDFGGPERWQQLITERWIKEMAAVRDGATELGILDGQTRPSFVRRAAERVGLRVVRIVLMDCAAGVRHARLVTERNQPELSNAQMECWAAYLREQADALDLPIIDTTAIGIEDAAERLLICAEDALMAHRMLA